jgi:aminoglycoside 6'-N-acetyltransferase
VIELRRMQLDDLHQVSEWLLEPHVARWYLAGSSVEQEIEDLRKSIVGEQAVRVWILKDDGRPIGWCQWYRCHDDPDWAKDIGANAEDLGMDYAIGSVSHTSRGIGTLLVAEMVNAIRSEHPDVSIFADPDERNTASRRILEKNGFELVAVKSVPSEATDDPMAIYRLGPGISASGR